MAWPRTWINFVNESERESELEGLCSANDSLRVRSLLLLLVSTGNIIVGALR